MVFSCQWLRVVSALSLTLLLSVSSSVTQAAAISLDADGTTFGAELLTGSSNIGVIFYHGRGQSPTGDVVRHLQTSLNTEGYTTLSLENPIPVGGTAFSNYDAQEDAIDDQVFARLSAALVEMSSHGVEHVVLSGFSLGSRFMTASAAAWDSGIFTPTVDIDLLGLVGVGMYGSFGLSAPTAAVPTTLGDFNVLDTVSNLAFISSLPVLDLFGSNDTQAVAMAGLRSAAYGGDASNYVQVQIECPANDGSYYAKTGPTTFTSYYAGGDPKRCHQLRNGWIPDGMGGFIEDKILRNSPTAPLEMAVSNFFADFIEPRAARVAKSVPESGALLSMLMGLLALSLVGRKKRGVDSHVG